MIMRRSGVLDRSGHDHAVVTRLDVAAVGAAVTTASRMS
ncbi:MAG: hypothetical protein QOJ37_1671, partial [Pseudonocardiales bacterium]|nr:hypothetical protein [Pseudonocardiales bacterium]